jgi:SAM-dependent methyltransferase
MAERPTRDYSDVTETPGLRVTAEALSMARARYQWAAAHAAGTDVLEIACGAGQGLGLLRASARRVLAGDVTTSLVRQAHRAYAGGIPLAVFDAHRLPFRNQSFDTVILFEALYYLRDVDRFLAECARVLRPGGAMLLCTVNPEWPEHHPSPHAIRYWNRDTLHELLSARGWTAEFSFGFPVDRRGFKRRVVSWMRRVASRTGLFPRTMRGKQWLKRVFYGPLPSFPAVLDPDPAAPAPIAEPKVLSPRSEWKVIYVLARKAAQPRQERSCRPDAKPLASTP